MKKINWDWRMEIILIITMVIWACAQWYFVGWFF